MPRWIFRLLLLVALVGLGAAAIAWSVRRDGADVDMRRLAWVATARQLGPVGYRDPAGAISPDGKLFAYSSGFVGSKVTLSKSVSASLFGPACW